LAGARIWSSSFAASWAGIGAFDEDTTGVPACSSLVLMDEFCDEMDREDEGDGGKVTMVEKR